MNQMTLPEWHAEATRRFGPDQLKWAFVCPACGHVATTQDYKDAGAPVGAVAFSCIGRYIKGEARDAFAKGPGPCNYAGGGLIGLNPLDVLDDAGNSHRMFAFAEQEVPHG